jgi:hypothetical protein
MADKKYKVDTTNKTTYLNNQGQAVEGYRVYFTMLDYDEGSNVLVSSLDPKVVQPAIDAVIKQRDALAAL